MPKMHCGSGKSSVGEAGRSAGQCVSVWVEKPGEQAACALVRGGHGDLAMWPSSRGLQLSWPDLCLAGMWQKYWVSTTRQTRL